MTAKPQEVVIYRGRESTVTLDGRAYPLVIVNTVGELDVEVYDQFFDCRTQWTDYAASKNQKIVVISISDSMKPPSAVVRKHIADKVKNDNAIDGLLCIFMVVPNAVLRGVVTAVLWVSGSSEKVKNTGSLADAVRMANRALSDAGLTPPVFDADSYIPPT